jgi:hypothetical protein
MRSTKKTVDSNIFYEKRPKTLSYNIKTADENLYEVKLKEKYPTTADLKKQIQKVTGVPRSNQILVSGSTNLHDDKELISDYDLLPGSTILLLETGPEGIKKTEPVAFGRVDVPACHFHFKIDPKKPVSLATIKEKIFEKMQVFIDGVEYEDDSNHFDELDEREIQLRFLGGVSKPKRVAPPIVDVPAYVGPPMPRVPHRPVYDKRGSRRYHDYHGVPQHHYDPYERSLSPRYRQMYY